VYTEHVMGRFVGPAGIEAFLAEGMKPVAPMTFSLEWHTVEGNRLAFWIWNHLPAPEGSEGEFCFPNMSIIEHDGNGKWTMEEDLYDPSWAGDAVMAWYTAGGSPAMSPDPSLRPRTPSHPKPPAVGPDRAARAGGHHVATRRDRWRGWRWRVRFSRACLRRGGARRLRRHGHVLCGVHQPGRDDQPLPLAALVTARRRTDRRIPRVRDGRSCRARRCRSRPDHRTGRAQRDRSRRTECGRRQRGR
jgi:hypothetical protein